MIQLSSVIGHPESYDLIRRWSLDPKMGEYFRRMAPAFVWNSKETVDQVFCNTYFIKYAEKFIGLAGILLYDQHNQKAEFSILIDDQNPGRRRKIAIDICKQMQSYVFDYLGYNKLSCNLLLGREKVGKALESEGFIQEAHLRDNIFFDGKFHDEIIWSRFREDRCRPSIALSGVSSR